MIITTLLTAARSFATAKIITTKWREVLIASLFLIIVYQNVSDTRWIFFADTIPHLRNKITVQDYELNLALQSNETLTDAINNKNEEIERWSDVTKQLEENTAELQDEIASIAIKANSRVRTVIQEVTPESCSAAFEYLRDSIPELKFND